MNFTPPVLLLRVDVMTLPKDDGKTRNLDREDGEAVEQIFAEGAGVDRRVDVAMGGGDDPHVHADLAAAADPLHGALLEHAQQLHLHLGGHVTDLVEKEGAAIGLLEPALVLGMGAGERAFLVTEQDGFQQIPGDRPAIDRDEGLAGAGAQGVDGAGEDFLAAAGRAGKQHRSLARRDLADDAAQGGHGRGAADDHRVQILGCGGGDRLRRHEIVHADLLRIFHLTPRADQMLLARRVVNGNG